MRKSKLLIATNVVLAIASINMVGCQRHEAATAPENIRVKTMVAETTDITATRVYSGTIEAYSGTEISFPVAGTLKRVYVSEGDHVTKGQLVAELDATSLQNAYGIAKSTLDEAQDAYNRMKMLHDSNSLPDMQWVQVQNTLQQAKNAEAIAKKALNDAKIYSPVSGYVSEKFLDAGMTAVPAAPVIKIVDINPIKVTVSVPENEIQQISQGQHATIRIGALDNAVVEGAVSERGVVADMLSRSYDVKIRLDNSDGKMLPGMICDVSFVMSDAKPSIILPMSAVMLNANNTNYVWVAKNGHAYMRNVTVGGMTDNGLIISEGVTAGDSIIVEGQQKVSQYSTIDPIK